MKQVLPWSWDMKWHMPDIHVAVALGDKLRLIELLEKYEAEKAAREQEDLTERLEMILNWNEW